MKQLKEVLSGESGNYILPFFWMHGEDHAVIRAEIEAVAACGIRALCIESRPHPAFGQAQWWSDVDVVMDEARKRNMRVWLLDDDKFPTGHANGAFLQHPEHAKLYLAQRHADLVGPAQDNAVLVAPFLPEDATLLAVLVCPRPDPDTTLLAPQDIQDVTHTLHDGFVRVTLAPGMYRLFVLFTTRTGGGRTDYVNLIDSASVRVLIDAVYEPHYARYKEDFGKTFAGFFSDEPEFGNTPGYDFHELPGAKSEMKLPWSGELETMLRAAWGKEFLKKLPALWYEAQEGAGSARFQYMDAATQLVRHCFSGQLGAWCAAHGVAYIGHVIEDDNAHTRLGCSTGHYFRHMQGQHMAGIDVVHHQILPGFTGKVHRWIGWETDGEFFHFGLARLAAGAAKLDEEKQGRAMCEIFGNYGWAEGVGLMKWLTDHMLVRGINHFVPHAFSPKFPDRDCPPHFNAGGHNPQFRFFGDLMRYMNRTAHLLSGGREHTDAAVLYHAEAEWCEGEGVMLFQKPLRALMEAQLCADVLPADALAHGTLESSCLAVNGYRYASLIVPRCDTIPTELAGKLLQAAAQGVQILFVETRPTRDTLLAPLPDAFSACGRVVSLDDLPALVRATGSPAAHLSACYPALRFFCTHQADGDVMMFFNESLAETVAAQVRLTAPCTTLTRYDAANNRSFAHSVEGSTFSLHLAPGESAVFIAQRDAAASQTARVDIPRKRVAIDTGWCIAARGADDTEFTPRTTLAPGAPLPNMNAAGDTQGFVGTFRYETTFTAQAYAQAALQFPHISDAAAVTVNGTAAGVILGGSGILDISGLLQNGENTLSVEIANTLVWQLKDPVSVFLPTPPTGLLSAPVLEYAL